MTEHFYLWLFNNDNDYMSQAFVSHFLSMCWSLMYKKQTGSWLQMFMEVLFPTFGKYDPTSRDFLGGNIMYTEPNLDAGPCGGNTLSSSKSS